MTFLLAVSIPPCPGVISKRLPPQQGKSDKGRPGLREPISADWRFPACFCQIDKWSLLGDVGVEIRDVKGGRWSSPPNRGWKMYVLQIGEFRGGPLVIETEIIFTWIINRNVAFGRGG